MLTSRCSTKHPALHQRGATARIQYLFLTKSGKYRGSTRATNNADHLLEHRNEVIQIARTADPSVTGLQARTAWWWLKVHAIPVARYLGKGSCGTDALREELEVENEGVKIPSTVRWLSGAASVKAGPLQRKDYHGIIGGLRCCGRVGLPIDPQRRTASPGTPL